MTAQLPISPHDSFPHSSFDDPAFEPQIGFDFDDANDGTLRNMSNNFQSLNAFNTANHGYNTMHSSSGNGGPYGGTGGPFPVGTNAFAPLQGMSSNIDPSNVWGHVGDSPVNLDHFSMRANGARPPSGSRNGVMQKRNSSVVRNFGQITPPDDTPPTELSGHKRKTSATSDEAPVARTQKMDKSERARNAAIQRHSKSKKEREKRKDSKQGIGSERSGEDEVEGKREKYREKNRLAAAKCRAKKKDNVEDLEERHRGLAAQNNWMRRQERELRDDLTRWRTLALTHAPESCHCQDVHHYNNRKASELAMGWSQPIASSPSDSMGSGSTAPSPGDFGTMTRHPSLSCAPAHGMMQVPAQQSFASPSNYAFASVSTPLTMQGMQALTQTAPPTDNPTHAFSSFLQSSPGGRAGFS